MFFKLVVLSSALFASAFSAPHVLLRQSPLIASHSVVGSVPTSISEHSSSVVHSAALAPAVQYVDAVPVVRASPIVETHSVVGSVPSTISQHSSSVVHSAAVAHSVPIVKAAPVVATHSVVGSVPSTISQHSSSVVHSAAVVQSAPIVRSAPVVQHSVVESVPIVHSSNVVVPVAHSAVIGSVPTSISRSSSDIVHGHAIVQPQIVSYGAVSPVHYSVW